MLTMANIEKEEVSTRGEWQQDSCSVGDPKNLKLIFFSVTWLVWIPEILHQCMNIHFPRSLKLNVDKWLLTVGDFSLSKDSSSILFSVW
jgi:hypothetical protein